MVSANAPATRGFNCGNCGAAVELRALRHTRAVACTSCGALLDPRDPNVHVLQTAALREAISPAIPLGSRGTWDGHPWEVIGFQRRSIEVDGERYSWDEYVLFNPYRGFRYFSTYEGHWNDIRTVRELPELIARQRPKAKHRGRLYDHFQGAIARTDYVLGEFPWRVRVNEPVAVSDYAAPPYLLSSEQTANETTWSLGVYTDPERIWEAFSVPGEPPRRSGVFANQPNPYKRRLGFTYLAVGILSTLLLLMFIGRQLTADREQVLSSQYVFQPNAAESALVTDSFALREPGTVEIALSADLRNAWLHFDLALINADSGTAYNVGRELSYYSGSDSDGPWTEGSQQGRLLLPRVPAGEYYVRVEPEGETAGQPVTYAIHVRRDVPSLLPYGLALLLLFVPAIVVTLRMVAFETRRLQESDYGS
jgi:DNA-directed RNA polymerase subunit RPC12/RpoP